MIVNTNYVKLKPHNFVPYTFVPNFFIDQCIAKANGEFIKVYLILLRYMTCGNLNLNLTQIADILLMTESDVLRALNYFQSERIITLTFENHQLTEIHFNHLEPTEPNDPQNDPDRRTPNALHRESPMPDYNMSIQHDEVKPQPQTRPSNHLRVIHTKPDYTNQEIANFASQDEFTQLFYIIQKYLGKTLSSEEVKTVIGFHDWLGLPIDVIELMIEYCVDNDHRNMRYIEKVAIDWADNAINTIEKAKVRTETYKRSYFTILKAYGITDRSPTPQQIKLMDRWLNSYQMDISVIEEACMRTINQINKAEMRYTDSILASWSNQGVKTLADLKNIDEDNKKTYASPKANPSSHTKSSAKRPNAFNDYDQRQYDYEALEKKAMELRMQEFNGKRFSS